MLEVMTTTKRGNVATAVANLEKRQKIDFPRVKTEKNYEPVDSESTEKENLHMGGSKINKQVKSNETNLKKESCCVLEETRNSLMNVIREESESPSLKKQSGGDDSSPEESTLKQTWSGSASPGIFSSGSDFSSTDFDDEEDAEKREKGVVESGDESGRSDVEKNKRNSITKDCNSDFHWIISSGKQVESMSCLYDSQRKAAQTKVKEKKENSHVYSPDRNRKTSNYSIFETMDPSVQLRLPPHGPGSLDRKRVSALRQDRDKKCKSSVVSRSPQLQRKSHARSLGDAMNFPTLSEEKRKDYNRSRDDWYQGHNGEGEICYQYNRSIYPGCYGGYCSCLHHHFFAWQSGQCRSNFGSCENLQEKLSRKGSFGSQKTLFEDRSLRKYYCPDSQGRLIHDSNEYLAGHCCSSDREKSYSWRLLGKSGPELEEKLIRLENDKESLQLQVSVLTEQVEAQSEKISDLQQSLDDKKQQLLSAEDLLQREILTRSSLETQKLELMSAISELKLQQAAVERENYELKEEKKRYQNVKPPMVPRNMSSALIQSTPVCSNRVSPTDYSNVRKSFSPFSAQDLCYVVSPASQPNSFSDSHHKYLISSTPNNKMTGSTSSPAMDKECQQSKDAISYISSSPQPNLRRSMDHYNSLPRQKILETQDMNQLAEVTGRNTAFGKGLTSLITLKTEKSYSAPNLAETEKQADDQADSIQSEVIMPKPIETNLNQNQGTPTSSTPSRKGIKKLFNKIKRSNSGNVNDLLGDSDFKRGRTRATIGPRIGGNNSQAFKPPDKPFAEWDAESLCGWLEQLNLENYVTDLKRWAKNGNQLLLASSYEIEKELGIKNHMHKKKLLLALQEMNEKSVECDALLKPAGCLDTAWVMRWLDDVGLPQHKEVFLTARIDGRMLHRLTMDDLATMHITSALHVASLKKGIKVLREYKMDPNCLTRRSVPNEPPPTPSDVALWTNHRVMEWLRVVDLAEYAPNLRGSGVHGALMVYETKFTADLLASLLNIPPNKTLLRRHLNTHFKELLGRDVIQAKREAETTLGYIPLTPSAKVKTVKKPQFTLKRKKKGQDVDFGDLVCPLDDGGTSGENSFSTNACMSANGGGPGRTIEKRHVPDVCPLTDPSPRDSPLTARTMRI